MERLITQLAVPETLARVMGSAKNIKVGALVTATGKLSARTIAAAKLNA